MPAFLTKQLEYVEGMVAQEYRLAPFREFLQVDSSVPAWADTTTLYKVKGFGEFKPVGHKDQSPQKASIKVTEDVRKIVEFEAAYEIFKRELERQEKLEIPYEVAKASANADAAEYTLNRIAALGMTGLFSHGLVNSPDVDITAAAGVWSGLTATQIVDEMHKICDRVELLSKQKNKANRIVLPLAAKQTAGRARNVNTDKTALQLFKEERPEVKIHSWEHLTAAGGGGSNRVVAFDDAKNVAKMSISQELEQGSPVPILRGYEVPQTFVTGGCMIRKAAAIAYLDGV